MRVVRAGLLMAGVLLLLAGSARAQAIGQIFGKATDATGAVLPGVSVTVAGTGLQRPLTAVTTATGAYTFPNVPIGTYTVTFELSGFKKASRPDITITTGFSALVDMKMEVGAMASEVTVTASAPVVDTKKTTTGGTFSADIMEQVPTARDPWQVINLAPAVTMSGVNVGGSASGQQLTPAVYGTSANVQWNIEGGNITDMASNSSASYYNFDSFQEIQVVTGGGDVSVQASGLFINLVTKSGSNVYKGSGVTTFENAKMQSQNVTEKLFNAGGSNGTGLSGNPLHRIGNYSAEFGGPIKRNRLWFWGSIDDQDINVGVANFFDTSNSACVPPPSTFAQLDQVQKCLVNDLTTIRDMDGKVNFQLNSANKFQFLFTTDNKVRNHRSASATTAPEATARQYAPGGLFGYFTPQLTHTWVVSDKLVFTNQATYVHGGFSLDYTDSGGPCGNSSYGRTVPTDPSCQWNTQALTLRTTSYQSRGLSNSSYFERPSWEVKSDGNYFLSHFLGGDHALKFGVGWRTAQSLSFSHYGGGANVQVECVGNTAAGCGAGLPVAVGSVSGIVPYQATIRRDSLANTRWQTWSSYIQDSYSHRRLRINGGVRQDWQTSKFLGGCVEANVLVPNLLPQQCQGAADPKHPFNNFSPRVSATYDLRGNGRTALHASYSYYFDTEIVLASNLSNLGGVNLTWGPNQSSGACSATAGAPCWNDANHDNLVQVNELLGTPTASTARFDPATGILSNVLPIIDPDVKIGRTREAIGGIDHELISNVHVSLDFIYRKYDNGTQSYTIGSQPGCATSALYPCTGVGFPLSQLYTGPITFTDPITGQSAPYYVVCQGCTRPSGAAGTTITGTSLGYQTYKGVSVAIARRLVNRWQMQGSVQYNNSRDFSPYGSYTDPQGVEFTNGFLRSGPNGNPRYQAKLFGSVQLPFKLNSGANLQILDGNVRTQTINGPGSVYGGTSGTISRTTLAFQPLGSARFPPIKLLDVNISRVITLPGGRDRVTLTLDCFNLFNANTIRSYSSSNLSSASYASVSSIVPPRVLRAGFKINF